MKSRAAREVNAGLLALAAALVLTALVAIHLLERMSPAITRVLDENVASLHASSEMLAELAAQRLPKPASDASHQRFEHALAMASHNQTEAGEAEPITELRRLWPDALEGEPRALERAIAAVASIDRVNRAAMQAASVDARRLGKAGAWVLALLGLLGFVAVSLVRRRIQRRVVAPLLELESVLLSVDAGDRLRRCATSGPSSRQQGAMRALNRLLDLAASQAAKPAAASAPAELVHWLLDARGGALALLDARGEVVSASSAALEMLSNERESELLGKLQQVASGSSDQRIEVVRRSETFALLAIHHRQDG
jgi:PAS domain-containing protein